MIVRTWRTRLQPGREGDFRRFAAERSLPMFRSQDGLLGVLFAEEGDERVVVTFWHDHAAVRRLEESPSFRETVAALESTGILTGEQQVEVWEVTGGWMNVEGLGAAVPTERG